MQEIPPINQIKAQRRDLDRESKLLISIFDTGFNLIDMARDGADTEHVVSLAVQISRISEYSGLNELAKFFYSMFLQIEAGEGFDVAAYDQHLYFLRTELYGIAFESGVNPSITPRDKKTTRQVYSANSSKDDGRSCK